MENRITPLNRITWFITIITLLYLTRYPGLFYNFIDWDEAAMMSEAYAMTCGQVLYKDVYHIHPLFQFFIFMPFFYLFPAWLAPHMIKLFNMILIFFMAVYISKILFVSLKNKITAFIGAIFFIYFMGTFQWTFSSYGEFYILLPLLCGLYHLLSFKKPFLIGICWGTAILFKQVAFFDIFISCIYLFFITPYPYRKKFKFFYNILSGILLPFTLAFLYPLYHHSVWQTIDSIFLSQIMGYSAHNEVFSFFKKVTLLFINSISYYQFFFSLFKNNQVCITLGSIIAITSIIFISYSIVRKKFVMPNPGFFIFVFFLFIGIILGLSLIGRFYAHYFIQLLPCFIFFICYFINFIPNIIKIIVLGLSLFLIVPESCKSYSTELSSHQFFPEKVIRSQNIAHVISTTTDSNDSIFLYREEAIDIYYLSERISPIGIYMYVDMDSFHTNDLNSENEKKALLLKNLPEIIVYGDYLQTYSLNTLSFMEKLLEKHYTPKISLKGCTLYYKNR